LFFIDGFSGPIIVVYAFAGFVLFGKLMHNIDHLNVHGKTGPESATYDTSSGKIVKIKATLYILVLGAILLL